MRERASLDDLGISPPDQRGSPGVPAPGGLQQIRLLGRGGEVLVIEPLLGGAAPRGDVRPDRDESLGLVDLRNYDTSDDIKKTLDIDACWATWSVPFDRDEDFHFIATAYYLSPPVRVFWEKHCNGPILWFGTTLEGIAEHLERIAADRAAAPVMPVLAAVKVATPATPA